MAYEMNGVGQAISLIAPTVNRNGFKPATTNRGLEIQETLTRADNCMINQCWYRGNEDELQQLYLKLRKRKISNNFWGKIPDNPDYDVTRIHSNLASMMVDVMANVCLGDMRDITFESALHTEIWQAIAKENHFSNLSDLSLKGTLAIGWGGFKLSYETCLSMYPIIEFYIGDAVEFVRHRGRVQEMIFKTVYTHNEQEYVLRERYGYGYVINNLFKDGNEVAMSAIPQTAGLSDVYFAGGSGKNGQVFTKGRYMMAVPFIIYPSSKYEGYGESIFEKKIGLLSSLDADLSQWQDVMEAGAPRTFIDKKYLGTDPNKGTFLTPNNFNRFFIVDGRRTEKGEYGIDTVQFDINWQAYYETRNALIDSILMGWMSPATLGMNLAAASSGESAREKEKVTMYTRAYIIEAMSEVVKELVMISIQSYFDYHGINEVASEPNVDFGDYASPTLDTVVATAVTAKQGGVMSTETAVREVHGDSKTEEWILEEVKRIKEEYNSGYADVNDPGYGDDVIYPEDDEEDVEDEPEDTQEDEKDKEEK